MTWPLLAAATTACATAVLATPVVFALMSRLGVVDRPDGRRKLHGRAVPLSGGLAVFAGTFAALGAAVQLRWVPAADFGFLVSLLAASATICLVGVADDAFTVRGRHKLIGQTAAALIVVAGGLVVRQVHVLGFDLDLGAAAVPLTMLWIVGAINAINLIDGMDGLASTVGAMIATACCAMAALGGRTAEAMVAASLAGAILGFLVFNFPPARIFLGDTGSMLIGLLLGVVAARASVKGPASVALLAPVAVWTLPLFDVGMALLRRKLTGRSIYATDRGHLHHRLSQRGLPTRRALALVAALCFVTTAGAVASVALRKEWLAPASAVAVASYLVLTRSFGHSELAMLFRKGRAFVPTLVPRRGGSGLRTREHRSRLQGNKEWDSLWESLVAFVERFGLSTVQLDVSLPALHEEFFASWKRLRPSGEGDRLFKTELPLSSSHGVFGTLRLVGRCPAGSSCTWVADLVEGLRPFEIQIAELLDGHADSPAPRDEPLDDEPAAAEAPAASEPLLPLSPR